MKDVSGRWKLDIAAVAHDISTRSLSPVALTEMMLDRIARIDPKLLSYVTVLKDDAISSARQAQKEIADGHYRGALHGVPRTFTIPKESGPRHVPRYARTTFRPRTQLSSASFAKPVRLYWAKLPLTSSRLALTRIQQRMLGI